MHSKAQFSLYGTLHRAAYFGNCAPINRRFFLRLTQSLPFNPRSAGWETRGHLVKLPAKEIARLKREVSRCVGAIVKHRRHFAHCVREDRVDTDNPLDPNTHDAYQELRSLQADLARAQTILKAATAD